MEYMILYCTGDVPSEDNVKRMDVCVPQLDNAIDIAIKSISDDANYCQVYNRDTRVAEVRKMNGSWQYKKFILWREFDNAMA